MARKRNYPVKAATPNLVLVSAKITVSTDGYAETPTYMVATAAGDGYWVLDIDEAFPSVLSAQATLVQNSASTNDAVKIRVIDTVNKKIAIQTQTADGTAGTVEGDVYLLLVCKSNS